MKLKNIFLIIILIVIVGGSIWYLLNRNVKQQREEVAFASKQIEAIPVKVRSAKKAILNNEIEESGFLEATSQVIVLSETEGQIIHMYRKCGDFVRKGTVIAKVDDSIIGATVKVAEANVEQQEKDMARFERLDKGNAITKHDVEEARVQLKQAKADLKAARKALINTTITAPISGYINQRFVNEGQLISGGTPVCEIVNNNALKVVVALVGKDVAKVSNGEQVSVRIPVFPEKTWNGTITAIAEKANQSMSFNVEITLEDHQNKSLKSGLYAEIHIPVPSEQMLAIPKQCIIGSYEKPAVFVVKNHVAHIRQIVIGNQDDQFVSILSGLIEGDQVVYSGQLNLSDNDRVNVIN